MQPPPQTAFVLGAGLGTRLKSLTRHRPKPLIPVCNQPLITRAFEHLHAAGVRQFVVNTHWQAQAYHRAFPAQTWNHCPLKFSHESPEILETAGGLKHAAGLLPPGEAFWVYNGDILSSVPLSRAWRAHCEAESEVTLILRSGGGPLHVLRDAESGVVRDIGRRLLPDADPGHLFTGIYLVEPRFLERIPEGVKLGVIPVFIEMIRQGARLGSVVLDEGEWWDLGSREQILGAHAGWAGAADPGADATARHARPGMEGKPHGPWIDPSASVAADASLCAATAVGARAMIGNGATLSNCVVWEDARIAPGSRLSRCIVTSGASVSGTHTDADL